MSSNRYHYSHNSLEFNEVLSVFFFLIKEKKKKAQNGEVNVTRWGIFIKVIFDQVLDNL